MHKRAAEIVELTGKLREWHIARVRKPTHEKLAAGPYIDQQRASGTAQRGAEVYRAETMTRVDGKSCTIRHLLRTRYRTAEKCKVIKCSDIDTGAISACDAARGT
mmetsp:Transcript_9758/g.19884  ORF Transcript_9758/g.19884 Transcript_9758/m.19884 type:complete len:105 (-) Transcript_9758:839-1153(-)